MKNLIPTLLIVFMLGGLKAQQFNSAAFALENFEFSFGGQTAVNLLSAPAYTNTFIQDNSSNQVFSPNLFQSYAPGVSLQWQIDPIEHEYLSYRYAQEWSYGLGYQTSYSYRLRGHELALGPQVIQFVYHNKTRSLRVSGSKGVGSEFDKERHFGVYDDIGQQVFGLQTALEESTLMLGLIREEFRQDSLVEPWLGLMMRLEYPEAWGFEAQFYWAHPIVGRQALNVSATSLNEDVPTSGLMVNLKLSYRFAYRRSYADLF